MRSKSNLQAVLFLLISFLTAAVGHAYASQPPGIVLSASGVSKIYPPFDTAGWSLTRGNFVAPTHEWDDAYAMDWSNGCHSDGQNVYAAISGIAVLIPDLYPRKTIGFGNRIAVVDLFAGSEVSFYHLQEFAHDIQTGDFIEAGRYVGKVGHTGNVQPSSTCAAQGGFGAHLHVVVHKGVTSLTGRPVTSVTISPNGASPYAANFGFVSPVQLIKGTSATVFAVFNNGLRKAVGPFAFSSQGWNFDAAHAIFNPVTTFPDSTVNSLPLVSGYWPPRDNALVMGTANSTVYLIDNGSKWGIPGGIFTCRGFSFADVRVVSQSELDAYSPGPSARALTTCVNLDYQAQQDMIHRSKFESRFGPVDPGSFSRDVTRDAYWELRWLTFRFSNGQFAQIEHITLRSNPSTRYTSVYDPTTNSWSPWTYAP